MDRCPSEDCLQQLLDDLLPAGAFPSVESHLEQCPACQETLNRLTAFASAAWLQRADRTSPCSRNGKSNSGPPPLPSLPGYEILGTLGHGGHGVVYRARDLGLNRIVALKLLKHGTLASRSERDRFLAEAQAAARLRHPHIAQVYAVDEQAGVPFFAMELLPSGNLAQRLGGMPLATRPAAELLERLARAVHHAHEHGVVHRDLKPANVLFADSTLHEPRISDFGLAKLEGTEFEPTPTEAVFGTPSYMAPEQAAGRSKQAGPTADVYALGAILYELLTGRPPFKAETPFETLLQVREQEAVPPRQLRPKLERNLETVCLKCLHKEPGRRYASAAALADDLRRFLAGQPVLARPVGWVERGAKWVRRRPTAAVLLAVALLALVGVPIAIERSTAATRAAGLVESLARAETNRVPDLVRELAPHRHTADSLLRQMAADAAPASRERLHAGLALLPVDPGQVPFLLERLLTATPEELLVLREALQPHRAEVAPRLWAVLDDPRADAGQRFRASCALAGDEQERPRLAPLLPDVARRLVAENVLLAGRWAEALKPIRRQLVQPLADIYRDGRRPESERDLAASLLADFASDQPGPLADWLLDASPRQFAALLPRLREHRDEAVKSLEEVLARQPRLTWGDAPLVPTWATPDPVTVRELEQAGGMLAERFAFCQALALDRFDALAERLSRCGYRPTRFRPYALEGRVQVAAVWARDGKEWKLGRGSADEVRRADATNRQRGYVPQDVTAYLEAGGTGEPALRFAIVWVSRESGSEFHVLIGTTWVELTRSPVHESRSAWKAEVLHTLPHQGTDWFSGIWHRGGNDGRFSWCELEPYLGTTFAYHVLTDVSLTRRASISHRTHHEPLKDLRSEPFSWFVIAPAAGVAGLPWLGLCHRIELPLSDAHDRCYSVTAERRADVESLPLLGQRPGDHLALCRVLAERGFRPAGLSAAWLGEAQGLRVASVWHLPVVREQDKDALARREANAAAALFHLGEPDALWHLLRHGPDPRVRTYLIHRLHALDIPPGVLIDRLRREEDVSACRALLLALGEYGDDQAFTPERNQLTTWLLQEYRDNPDPGIHSAVDWLLRQRWGKGHEVERLDAELAGQEPGGRRWYVNRHGYTLAVIPGPVDFIMGAPLDQVRRTAQIVRRQAKQIPRSFAVATREVTLAQLREFLRDHPDIKYWAEPSYTPDDRCPAVRVPWHVAAQYCRWLSEKECLPEEECCFPSISEIEKLRQESKPVPLPADYLSRTGYRLPTSAEWEYACRAGAATLRPYGHDAALLDRYAWFMANADDNTWPVGRLKPNDLGLFDCLGNVWEWCQESWDPAQEATPVDREWVYPAGTRRPQPAVQVARGGSFLYHATFVTAAARYAPRLDQTPDSTIGFRVARTVRVPGQ